MVSRYLVSRMIYVNVGWGCWATISTGAVGAGDAGSADADAPRRSERIKWPTYFELRSFVTE